jgi:D-methionine transport system ATP-binding protein
LLAELNRELGLTLVLITHEMEVIRRICDQVAVLDAGFIVEQGAVADVFLHPQHPTTQRFVQEAEQIDELELHEDFAQVEGRILRLTFHGQSTYEPLLGRVARKTGVDFTILAGRIDRIRDVPYGQLTVAFEGGEFQQAMDMLEASKVHLEVLR